MNNVDRLMLICRRTDAIFRRLDYYRSNPIRAFIYQYRIKNLWDLADINRGDILDGMSAVRLKDKPLPKEFEPNYIQRRLKS